MNFLEYLLFLILKNTVPLFPLKLWHFTAKAAGKTFYYILPIRKKTAYENLRLAYPDKSQDEINKIIKECYINALTVIAEFFYMKKLSEKNLASLIDVTNIELINQKLNEGKGLILISAHFGNWELGAYALGILCGNPLHVIVKPQSNKQVNERINSIRSVSGNRMIDMKNAPREVLALLKQNKIAAMLGDQAAPKENVRINFFINNVPAFEGTAKFAIKTRAAVLFGVPLRGENGTYSLTLHEIDIEKYKEATEENIRALTQEHTDLLVSYINKKPGHWLWFHRRFKNVDA